MIKGLSPKQKRLALIAGAGLLALMFALSRRSQAAVSAAATQPQVGSLVPPSVPPADMSAGTGADNSSYLADLGNQIGGLTSSVDTLSSSTVGGFGQLGDAFVGLQQQLAEIPASQGTPGPAGAVAQQAASTPPAGPASGDIAGAITKLAQAISRPAATPASKPKAGLPAKTPSGAPIFTGNSGRRYRLVQRPGNKWYRYYESKPGRGDFMSDKNPTLRK